MKRKELTKFLAMMMCVAMVTGSGVPVSAADLAADEIAVETQEEDEDYTEGDTEEVVADEEADADTDVAGNAEDAADLFSDEETDVPDAGEETSTEFSLKASLNDNSAVDAVVTTEKERVTNKNCTVVNITFKSGDLKEEGNTVSLTPTLGTGGAGFKVGSRLTVQGVQNPYSEKTDGSWTTALTTVDNTPAYCSVTRTTDAGTIQEWYVIKYHVAQEMSLSGQIVNDDYTSESRKSTVVEKTGTYNSFEWAKEVNLTFESSDAKADEMNTVKITPKLADGESLVIGTGASKGAVSNALTATDGVYSINIGKGNGPAKLTKSYYCTRTYADGTTENYKINIVRKGYAGITGFYGMSESSPANGIWTTDTTTGKFKMWMPLATYPQGAMGATVYDDEGNAIPTSEYTFEMSPDYKGENFYIEDGYLWAKGAGASGDCMVVKCRDKSYPFYIKAAYGYNGKTILNARATDGTTTLNTENFADADAFVALFPEAYKENARTFYALVTECQAANSWDSSISGKFWDDDCESAKLNKIIAMSSDIWSNIYGIKDAKDALTAAADLDNVTDEAKKEELSKALEAAKDQIDADYKDGKITSLDDVTKIVDTAKRTMSTINPSDIATSCTVSLKDTEFTYDGQEKKPEVIVMNGENPVDAADYTVEYKDNVKAGTATVTVKGANIYNGQTELTFKINPADQKITLAADTYNKTAGDAAFALDPKSVDGAAFTYVSDNEKVATVDANGKVTPVAEGTAVITVTAKADNYNDAVAKVTVKVAKKAAVAPVVTKTEYKVLNVAKASFTKTEGNKAFKLGVKTKVKGTVAYKSSNKKVVTVDKKGKVKVKGPGRAVITVTGKAKGFKNETAQITITVKPSAKLSAKAAAQSGKKLKVTWKRNKKASGYQIVVATDKSFKNVVKTVNVKKNKTVKATVKGLKSGRKYYVRVRSMKKSSGVKVYGNWSKAKPVKAKK